MEMWFTSTGSSGDSAHVHIHQNHTGINTRWMAPPATEKPKEKITAKTRTIFVTSPPATDKSNEKITAKTRTIFVTTPTATEKLKERTTANSRTILVTTPFATEKPEEEITAKTRSIFVTSHATSTRPKGKISTETGPSTLKKNSSSTSITQISLSSTWKKNSYSTSSKKADKLFGSAIPIYILIFGIGSILAISVPTVVLISGRKKRKGYSTGVQQ